MGARADGHERNLIDHDDSEQKEQGRQNRPMQTYFYVPQVDLASADEVDGQIAEVMQLITR